MASTRTQRASLERALGNHDYDLTWSESALAFLRAKPKDFKHKCTSCKERLPETHFRVRGGFGEVDWICNTCRATNGQHGKLSPFSFMEEPAEWQEQAQCTPERSGKSLADIDVAMFPRSAPEVRERVWESLCEVCPVRAACAKYAEDTNSVGVWGGEYRPMPSESRPPGSRNGVLSIQNSDPGKGGQGRPRLSYSAEDVALVRKCRERGYDVTDATIGKELGFSNHMVRRIRMENNL